MKLREWRTEESPQLMIIPMIDIIFFLLVFFMMSMLSMVVQKSIPISLPTAQVVQVDLEKKLPVTVTAEGKVFVEQEAIPLNLLGKRLQLEQAQGRKVTVILRGDKNVAYGQFVVVLDTIKQAGITRISIAAEQ